MKKPSSASTFVSALLSAWYWSIQHICLTLEQGFIILRLHYISSAISAPFARNLPITGASILSRYHEMALSLWSPSPSKKNSSITSSRQRPPRVKNITSGAWQPCITHTVIVFFFFFWFGAQIFSAKQIKAAVIPPVMSPGGRFISQILYLVTIWEKSSETPISEAIKQSARWLGSPNQRTLSIQQAFPGASRPLSWFHQIWRWRTRPVLIFHPDKLLTSSSFLFFPLMIGGPALTPEITCICPWPLLEGQASTITTSSL